MREKRFYVVMAVLILFCTIPNTYGETPDTINQGSIELSPNDSMGLNADTLMTTKVKNGNKSSGDKPDKTDKPDEEGGVNNGGNAGNETNETVDGYLMENAKNMTDKFLSFTEQKEKETYLGSASFRNDAFQKKLLEGAYHGKWPSVESETIDGANVAEALNKSAHKDKFNTNELALSVYIQNGDLIDENGTFNLIPYVIKSDSDKQLQNWHASFVYDIDTGKWMEVIHSYDGRPATNTSIIAGLDKHGWADLRDEAMNAGFLRYVGEDPRIYWLEASLNVTTSEVWSYFDNNSRLEPTSGRKQLDSNGPNAGAKVKEELDQAKQVVSPKEDYIWRIWNGGADGYNIFWVSENPSVDDVKGSKNVVYDCTKYNTKTKEFETGTVALIVANTTKTDGTSVDYVRIDGSTFKKTVESEEI